MVWSDKKFPILQLHSQQQWSKGPTWLGLYQGLFSGCNNQRFSGLFPDFQTAPTGSARFDGDVVPGSTRARGCGSSIFRIVFQRYHPSVSENIILYVILPMQFPQEHFKKNLVKMHVHLHCVKIPFISYDKKHLFKKILNSGLYFLFEIDLNRQSQSQEVQPLFRILFFVFEINRILTQWMIVHFHEIFHYF